LVAGKNRACRGGGHAGQDARLARGSRAPGVKALHSYAVPAIMVLPVESVDADYYRWILEEAKAAS
jgi:hypothetical protein